jgi:hypothetical protein
LATAASRKRIGKESAGIRPRFSCLIGGVLCLAVSACAHRIPASLESSVGNEGAFGTTVTGVGPWFWARTYSYLPGPTAGIDWQVAATAGNVTVHAPRGEADADSASVLAADIRAAIGYLYPRDGDAVPVERFDVHLVPEGYGVSEQHSSMGRSGKLSARFYLRNLGPGNLLKQRAYTAGTVAHELVHVQRRLAGIAVSDDEESIATLLETCSVLVVLDQVSPTFSELAARTPASDREQELVSSARAAAELAFSLPPTVYAGTAQADVLLASCAEHWEASRYRGKP